MAFSHQGICPISGGTTLPVTAQRPHLQIPVNWGVDFNVGVWRGHSQSITDGLMSSSVRSVFTTFPTNATLQCLIPDMFVKQMLTGNIGGEAAAAGPGRVMLRPRHRILYGSSIGAIPL